VVIVNEPSCPHRGRQDSHSTWINHSGSGHYHYPDFLVRREHERPLLCEVSRQNRIIVPVALAQFALMSATASAAGWEFELRTELPAQRIRTQSHVHACRFAVPLPHDLDDRLASISWPAQLRDLVGALDGGQPGMTAALHLLATARLFVNYDELLRDDSLIFRDALAAARAWVVDL
jgi:hypothetical protein